MEQRFRTLEGDRGRHHRPSSAVALTAVLALVTAPVAMGGPAAAQSDPTLPFEVQSLDGTGNNTQQPEWGQAGNDYRRVAPAEYADGVDAPRSGPNARHVSNRIFNDSHQNLFSERNVSHWGFAWGQFLDHTFALRRGTQPDEPQGEQANIPFDPNDPLEEFENDLDVLQFQRSAPSPGTGAGEGVPREQVNTISSYLDAWAVYGGSEQRLEWLREGPVDGDLSNNGARLLLPDGYLPRRDARGDPEAAPAMDAGGRLRTEPERAAVAGDVRANETQPLTIAHTLFAREHNRIVDQLPDTLDAEEKFQTARRVVIAEQQYITYHEFLPAMGVTLPQYTGYDPDLRTDLTNEFATVGYRAHSFVHGELELETEADRYTDDELASFEDMGMEVVQDGDEVEIAVPLNLAFFNPDLLEDLQLAPLLQGLGLEAQYRNDEQIDNQLRSVLFEIPVPGNPDCLDGPDLPECFGGITDLGVIDVARARDHGIPRYNELRQAYGLAPVTSFTELTGEDTAQFPSGMDVDDPASLEFEALFDIDGAPIPLDSDAAQTDAVRGERASTLAARLQAIYGSVEEIGPFVGMLSEPHVPGTDFGELQLAIWTDEFRTLRDGDRFFYGNDPGLSTIRDQYGIDYRTTLNEMISANTDLAPSDLNDNVFLVEDEEATTCQVAFEVTEQYPDEFLANVEVTNTGTEVRDGWELTFQFPNGQQLQDGWNAQVTQDGPDITIAAPAGEWPGELAPGESATAWLRASWDGATNAVPTHYTMDGDRCTT